MSELDPRQPAPGDDARTIPAGLNLCIVVVQLAAIAGCCWAVSRVTTWWQAALLGLPFGLLMNSVYAVIHEAEHGVLHPRRAVNDGLGVLMALFFPAPYHLIRQGHIGHHLRNRSDDEAFDLWFDDESYWAKCAQWYSILTGVFWISIVFANLAVLLAPGLLEARRYRYNHASRALFESLNPTYRWWIRGEAVLVIATHVGIVWSLGIAPLHYALMYFGFGFSWSALQYLHHYGTERHITRGARNVWLGPVLDHVLLHHNWHLTHHKHPTVSWIHLPELGRREDPRRSFLLWHYFKMWRPPQRADERVENRYAGEIIR